MIDRFCGWKFDGVLESVLESVLRMSQGGEREGGWVGERG